MSKKEEIEEKANRSAMEDLFMEWKALQYKISGLGAIIQNYGFYPSEREVEGWNNEVEDAIVEINDLRKLTISLLNHLSKNVPRQEKKNDSKK